MARTIKTMDYAEQMWQWAHRSSGLPKPRADFQEGSHIDTLPVEHNRRGSSGVMMPSDYLMYGELGRPCRVLSDLEE